MSSRALRKAQQRASSSQFASGDSLQTSNSESEEFATHQRVSAFSVLLDEGSDEAKEDDSVNISAEERPEIKPNQAAAAKNKSKKKKRKAKKTGVASSTSFATVSDEQGATGSTELKNQKTLDPADKIFETFERLTAEEYSDNAIAPAKNTTTKPNGLSDCLSIETSHLIAETEMKKLFGNVAFSLEQNIPGNREQNVANRAGGRAQSSIQRYKGLGGSTQRRNIFAKWRDTWPPGTTGGLGMEIVGQGSNGVVIYSFIHNSAYRSAQREFNICVASMEPKRLIDLLHFSRRLLCLQPSHRCAALLINLQHIILLLYFRFLKFSNKIDSMRNLGNL